MLDVSPNIYTHIYKWLKCFKYKCVLFGDTRKNIEKVKQKDEKVSKYNSMKATTAVSLSHRRLKIKNYKDRGQFIM